MRARSGRQFEKNNKKQPEKKRERNKTNEKSSSGYFHRTHILF